MQQWHHWVIPFIYIYISENVYFDLCTLFVFLLRLQSYAIFFELIISTFSFRKQQFDSYKLFVTLTLISFVELIPIEQLYQMVAVTFNSLFTSAKKIKMNNGWVIFPRTIRLCLNRGLNLKKIDHLKYLWHQKH